MNEQDQKQVLRSELELRHGSENVFDTDEVTSTFSIEGFSAPYCYGKRRDTGESVTLEFIHMPRLYWIV